MLERFFLRLARDAEKNNRAGTIHDRQPAASAKGERVLRDRLRRFEAAHIDAFAEQQRFGLNAINDRLWCAGTG
jgi:hypothetical protein